MSKFNELKQRQEKTIEDQNNAVRELSCQVDKFNGKIEKLYKEFNRKIKQHVKGIKLNPLANAERFIVYIGKGKKVRNLYLSFNFIDSVDEYDSYKNVPRILEYRSNLWIFDEDVITKQIAEALKAIYIEYFGEL